MNKCTENSCRCWQRFRRPFLFHRFFNGKDKNKNGKHFTCALLSHSDCVSNHLWFISILATPLKFQEFICFLSRSRPLAKWKICVSKQPSWSLWLVMLFLCRTNDYNGKKRLCATGMRWWWYGCMVTRAMIIGKENIKLELWLQMRNNNIYVRQPNKQTNISGMCIWKAFNWKLQHTDSKVRNGWKEKKPNGIIWLR